MLSPLEPLRDRIVQDYLADGARKPGERLPSTRQLAARYEVSTPTLSKAVALLVAEGWVTVRHGSGIYAASAERARRNRSRPRIGCVVQSLRPVLAHRIFEGVERVARRRDVVVEVATTEWDYAKERRQIEKMRARGVQGVVLYPTAMRDGSEEYLAREFRDFPIVVVDLYQPAMKRPHLLFDNEMAGRRMTEFLISQGRRTIAFLKLDDAIPVRSLADRWKGYRVALEDAGIPYVDECVIRFDGRGVGSAGHIQAMERLLALKPRPEALMVLEDRYTEPSADWLRARGVNVPEEMMVAGFDNLQEEEDWGEKFPTTQPDFMDMGARAAGILLERVKSRDMDPTGLILPCPMVVPTATAGGIRQKVTTNAVTANSVA